MDMHAVIKRQLKNDVKSLVKRMTITEDRIIECMDECVPELIIFGDIIIGYLSDHYPFLIEPSQDTDTIYQANYRLVDCVGGTDCTYWVKDEKAARLHSIHSRDSYQAICQSIRE